MKKEAKFGLLDNPSQVYNWDQSGFSPNVKDYVGIFRKGSQRNHAIAQGAPKGHLSTMWSVSADGRQKLAKTIHEAERLGFFGSKIKIWLFYSSRHAFLHGRFCRNGKKSRFSGPLLRGAR